MHVGTSKDQPSWFMDKLILIFVSQLFSDEPGLNMCQQQTSHLFCFHVVHLRISSRKDSFHVMERVCQNRRRKEGKVSEKLPLSPVEAVEGRVKGRSSRDVYLYCSHTSAVRASLRLHVCPSAAFSQVLRFLSAKKRGSIASLFLQP